MKERYYGAIVNGVTKSSFPPVPVDYGYRDSTNFWYTRFPRLAKPIAEPIPAAEEVDIDSIRYAANRADDTVKFTDDALKNFVKVPQTSVQSLVFVARRPGTAIIDGPRCQDEGAPWRLRSLTSSTSSATSR